MELPSKATLQGRFAEDDERSRSSRNITIYYIR